MTIKSIEKILKIPSIGNFKCIELFEVIGIKIVIRLLIFSHWQLLMRQICL